MLFYLKDSNFFQQFSAPSIQGRFESKPCFVNILASELNILNNKKWKDRRNNFHEKIKKNILSFEIILFKILNLKANILSKRTYSQIWNSGRSLGQMSTKRHCFVPSILQPYAKCASSNSWKSSSFGCWWKREEEVSCTVTDSKMCPMLKKRNDNIQKKRRSNLLHPFVVLL